MERARIEKQKEEERLKQEAIEAEKLAKKNKQIAFKSSLKALTALCQETLPGTRYDKFWVESYEPQLKTTERVEQLMATLTTIKEDSSLDHDKKVKAFE